MIRKPGFLAPAIQVEQAGEVSDELSSRTVPSWSIPGLPGTFGDPLDRIHLRVDARPADGEFRVPASIPCTEAMWANSAWEKPAHVEPDQHVVPVGPGKPGDGPTPSTRRRRRFRLPSGPPHRYDEEEMDRLRSIRDIRASWRTVNFCRLRTRIELPGSGRTRMPRST